MLSPLISVSLASLFFLWCAAVLVCFACVLLPLVLRLYCRVWLAGAWCLECVKAFLYLLAVDGQPYRLKHFPKKQTGSAFSCSPCRCFMVLVSCLRLQVCPFAVLAFPVGFTNSFPPSLISVLASLSDLLSDYDFFLSISSASFLFKENLSIFFLLF